MKEDKLVLKHTELVAISQGFASMDTHRVLIASLKDHLQWDKTTNVGMGEEYYKVDVADYAAKGGISLGRAYTEILEQVDRVFQQEVCGVLENGDWVKAHLISSVRGNSTNYTISFKWNRDALALISGKMEDGKFIYVDSRLSAMKNVRHYNLAEMLNSKLYLLSGKYMQLNKDKRAYFKVTVGELRRITQTTDRYKVWKDFKMHILDKTLEELFKVMGTSLGYSLVKVGKKVYEVEFFYMDRKVYVKKS